MIGKHQNADTDTNGAIAGAVLGCKLGLDKMMQSAITRENLEIMLNQKTNRPVELHPVNIEAHVRALL